MDVQKATLTFDSSIYSSEALMKASYGLSSHAYFLIKQRAPEFIVSVEARSLGTDLIWVCNEFKCAALDQQLRLRISEETKLIKESIIATALREAGVE